MRQRAESESPTVAFDLPVVETLTRRALGRSAVAALAGLALGRPELAWGWESRAHRRRRTELHNRQVIGSLFDVEVPLHDWSGIVVHHTATKSASRAGIDAYHRNHFGDPLGAEYHFVINNGRKLPEGWIEIARWRHQAPAWHLFKPERAPNAVAICLVGNFEEQRVGTGQFDALVKLTQALMHGLAIRADSVTTHRGVDGRLTQCPGQHFPHDRFLAQLRAKDAARLAAIDPAPAQQTRLLARPSLRCLP